MRIGSIVLALILGCLCNIESQGADAAPRKKMIEAMEQQASVAALERKKRSENLLRSEGVKVNDFLPAIEDERQATTRNKKEVAQRALALLAVALKGEGVDRPTVDRIVADYGLEASFSPSERVFIRELNPSQQDRVQFSWRYEAAWTLLWALGYVEKLEKPTGICDVKRAVGFMRDRSAAKFIDEAKLRPLPEILEHADRIYRYHWAVVDARLAGGTASDLDPGVTMERHYALNWLIGYMGAEWDEISTDT